MDIKSLLENDNYIIVLDTNVLLNIYRYSPEFSEFALNCLQAVKDDVVLPATVRLEYGKHCRAEFSKMQDRAKNAGNETADQIKRSKEKVLATCDKLERLRFPDVDDLRDSLSSKLDEVQEVLEEFFQERSSLDLISHAWNGTDYVIALVNEWEQSQAIMSSPSQEDIYLWCEEGETRYKKEIPPGFKDAKNKDGVRKYSDLILWKEVLKFAVTEQKNVIFVTDDVVTYQFDYNITAEGVSYEYWGRDDDTREVIRSYGTEHMFEGTISVEVQREADIFLDFEDDNAFDETQIVYGELKETEYNERWDEEPEYGELGTCPNCGCPLDTWNDAGGFCIDCARRQE